ncbi:MAG: PAS domain S-box protein [Verrucomicrobia bacterium]|nr:PAS domain S-box protein [Verrucomicrobiota bacterium]
MQQFLHNLARLQSVVENLAEGLLITDLDDVVLYVNSRLCELTGFSRQEFLGARAYELLLRREEWSLALQRDQQRAQGQSEAYETLTLCRNGGSFWAQVHASPLRDENGEIVGTVGAVTDITDRKLAETALRETSELYRAMFETNQAIKLLLDPASGRIVDANSAASRFYGYDLAQLKGMEIFHINSASPERVRELLQRAAEQHDHHFEVRHRLASGEVREVELHTGPLEVNGRKLIFSIVNDLTERRRAEKSLQLRVQLERLIADISSHFINIAAEEIDAGIHQALQRLAEFSQLERSYVFLYTAEGASTSRTHEWCAAGISSRRDAFQNLSLNKFPWFKEQIPRLVPIQVSSIEDLPPEAGAERFLMESGGLKSLLLVPMVYGKSPVGFFGFDAMRQERRWSEEEVTLLRFVGEIFVNALERKKSAAEIESLAAFPRYNPNMVIEFTPEGKLAYFNAAARAMAHDLGKGNMRDILPPGTPQIVNECLTTNQPRLQLNTAFGLRTLSWSFFPVPAIPAVHCYAVEITERLNIEAQLRQAQKMESIGQLAAGLAHDFNNVLTVITGHAGLLLHDKQLRPEQIESIRQMADATERASNLTRQLLTFSRKQVMQPRTLELHEVITQLTKMLARILGEDITLQFEYASDLPPIHADQGMMEQILLNLAVNARDAMPKGGRLNITATTQTIDEAYVAQNPLARPGQFVRLCVEDTGCGIARENLHRLFEPFFTTKDVGKGTGLGLATVYGIVRQHEGWIEVASELGHGATFKIFLPVADRIVPPKPIPRSAAAVRGGNERVLVVEDEPALCALVRQILSRFGYQVEVAGSGVAALKLWEKLEGRVDLLLTDMVMPEGISGRELAEHLTAKKPGLKIIYSSGYSAEMAGQDLTLREGFNFLQKPYDPMKLAQTVRESLDR